MIRSDLITQRVARFHLRRLRNKYSIVIFKEDQEILVSNHLSHRFFFSLGFIHTATKRHFASQFRSTFRYNETHKPYIDAIMVGAHPMSVVRRYLEDYPLRELGDKKRRGEG